MEHLDAAERIIFPSRATCDAIAPRLSHERWDLIPYGLSSRWFDDPVSARTRACPPEAFVVGFAGTLRRHKGPHVLLDAARRLGRHGCTVRIAGPFGKGAYGKQLRKMADGLDVEFLGQLPSEGMPAFLRGLDVLVVTSLWPENLPFVMLEAQAAGVPVVASNVSGMAQQIPDGRLLFEPGSGDGLAAALSFAREFPQVGRQAVVRTVEEMTDATEAVYREAIARRDSS